MCSNRHTGGGRRGWAMGLVVMTFRMDFEKKNDELSTVVVFPRPCCFRTTCYEIQNGYESQNYSGPHNYHDSKYSYDSQNNPGPKNDLNLKNDPAPYNSKNNTNSSNYTEVQYKLNHTALR
jgi:hypothetical protein